MFLFALKTLAYDRGKLLIALVGVIFSIVLINVQMGLLLGLVRKGSLLVDHAGADIWVGRRGVENVDFAFELPESWLNRIRGLPGVARAEPYVVSQANVTLPNGEYENCWIIGAEHTATMGLAWNITEGSRQLLRQPDSVTIDELDAWKLGNPQIGDTLEINGQRARVVATTKGILAFTNTPFLFTGLDAARAYCRMRPGYCSYFLVKASDGVDPKKLCAEIAQLIPYADAFTTAEFSRKSQFYWLARTGIGISFGTATALGLIVGLVMVGQSLYALTLDHLSDFATLKAIGAENWHILSILVTQAMTIAIVGTIIGVIAVRLIAEFLATPVAPIDSPTWLIATGVSLNFAICLFASFLPFRRILRVDPATVLQG